MKKVLSILFIGLISIMFLPFNVDAEIISTLEVLNNNNKLTVFGTTENGVLAVAILVYSGENLTHIETCSSNNNEYSCELNKTFDEGNYIVKVADYDGGDYISKNISISTTENNPKTSDNIMSSIVIGGLSILTIGVCMLLRKKKILSCN